MLSKVVPYGISFLDEATSGMSPGELIMPIAPSGVGKTQLTCIIATACLEAGKKCHLFSLEAGEYEIERRLLFNIVANFYYSDPKRPKLSHPLTFRNWRMGILIEQMLEYEDRGAEFYKQAYKDLILFVKKEEFTCDVLIKQVMSISIHTDLIIIDHAHFFDMSDTSNENRELKKIAVTCRDLAASIKKPIVLVAHQRKRDKFSDELIAGMEEVHGSSDLFKIAHTVITVAPGPLMLDGNFETYFRIAKSRFDSGSSRFAAKCTFDPRKGVYDKQYNVGFSNQSRAAGFAELDPDRIPDWATSARRGSGFAVSTDHLNAGRSTKPSAISRGKRSIPNRAPYAEGN